MSRLSHWWRQFRQHNERSAPAAAANMRVNQATQRARRQGFWQRAYESVSSLFTLNPLDLLSVIRLVTKWSLLGGSIGVAAGTASAIFLTALAWATQVRLDQPWLLWLLPFAGLGIGWIYYQFGGTAVQGNNLVIDEVNRNHSRIPLRMAPLVLLGTIVTHLFGGSAGREGTAIQMGASLADGIQRLLRLNSADRRMSLMAGISGGFGSVFGVPVAGAIFGMEVQSVGRIHYEGLVPCLIAAYVGDLVTRAWGVPHAHYPQLPTSIIEPGLLLKVAAAGVAFGLTSLVFVELIHGIKRIMALVMRWTPLHLFLGGFALIGLTLLLGTRDYLGLSLPLIERSFDGSGVVGYAFLLKLLFTAVTLGTGYLGGEVTPLFVVGSTLGYSLGVFLGVDPLLLAAIGLVAVFAGASNTPFACAIMGVELFGGGAILYLFLGCTVAYLASGHRGIYATQGVSFAKAPGFELLDDDNLRSLAARRRKIK
jgi:H+/Cl- antiporter ClcA